MIVVCDLADDFRDAILDYLVSNNLELRTPANSLMRLIALAAECNLQPELHIDRKSQDPYFERTWMLIDLYRTRVRYISASDWLILTIQQLNRRR